MLPKLPNSARLKKEILNKAVINSITFVQSRRTALRPYRLLEDLLVDAPDPLPEDLKGVDRHLDTITTKFRKTLYFYSVYIGSSVLDQIIFDNLRNPDIDDPIGSSLDIIRSFGLHRPGLILYPLHSFGLLGIGVLEKLYPYKYEFFLGDEMCIRGQTNSLEGTIEFIERAAASIGIERSAPRESIEHYYRSRPTKWLTHNPLLIVKTRSFSGSYFENQRFLMLHLERACSTLLMLGSMQNGFPVRKEELFFSTRRVNNWETQDIYHYLLLEPQVKSRTRFKSSCVPMNYAAVKLTELSNVNIDINLRAWARRRAISKQIFETLATLELEYLRSNMISDGLSSKGRAVRKIMTSLRYFRRSFRFTSGEDDIVNMAIALEVLLTDYFAPQIDERLMERVEILLQNHKRKHACMKAVERVYKARNQAVHTGIRTIDVDLPTVREAYTYCVLSLATRLPHLPKGTPDPMTQLVLQRKP